MAEPREYRILLNLQAALRAIASPAYFNTVAALAVKLDPDANVQDIAGAQGLRPFVILEPKPELWDWPGSEKPNGILLRMPVTIYFVSEADQTDDTSLLKSYFRGLADVEQAIATETVMGTGANNLAQMPKITNRSFASIGSEVWSLVDAEITLRRQYGQPNG